MPAHEVNFDGLVGPTHSYAGLAYGNLASQAHRHAVSSPRRAALEGLAKMKFLAGLGVGQAVLPPQERPDLEALRRLGFSGTDARVLERAHREEPALLAACCSASSMWAANAATVSPSADAGDGRVHLTPANLVSQLHRSLEPATTSAVLRAIFPDEATFAHHAPLPAATPFGDEGAANHTRLCADHAGPGVELFVYGRRALDPSRPAPVRYPARQTYEAAAAVARLHQLRPDAVVFAQQSPSVIDAGVFHNDVIAVGHRHVLLCHERAWVDQPRVLDDLRARFARTCGGALVVIQATGAELPVADAVSSYLFNSQLVTRADGTMALIAPAEASETPAARAFAERVVAAADNPVAAVHYVDVRQSMRNGGGPACLRLRVALTDAELARVRPGVLFDDALHARLVAWVERHYRDALTPEDLADPSLVTASRDALDELTRIVGLGAVYRFQRTG